MPNTQLPTDRLLGGAESEVVAEGIRPLCPMGDGGGSLDEFAWTEVDDVLSSIDAGSLSMLRCALEASSSPAKLLAQPLQVTDGVAGDLHFLCSYLPPLRVAANFRANERVANGAH